MDAVRYRGSFAGYIDGIKDEPDNVNAFHYRNEMIKFRGRSTELKALSEFIEKGSGEQARCVERLEWKLDDGTPFLPLMPLEDAHLKEIIEDYAKKHNRGLSERQKEQILERERLTTNTKPPKF